MSAIRAQAPSPVTIDRSSLVRAAMANASNLEADCPVCGDHLTATIGGGVPLGARLAAGHQPDGSHRPSVFLKGEQIR